MTLNPVPAEQVVRALMYRNNQLCAAWRSLARRFGGDVGRTIVATMRSAESRADEFERTLRAGGK